MESRANTGWDELVVELQHLRASVGNPSYGALAARIGELRSRRGEPNARPGRSTVFDAFQLGRRRLDAALLLDLVAALGRESDVSNWSERIEKLLGAYDGVPLARLGIEPPVDEFTGREDDITTIVTGMTTGPDPERLWALTGIGGAGKSQLARGVADRLIRDGHVDRIASLDLRSNDPSVAPASARSALDSLLRLVGVAARGSVEVRRAALERALRAHRWAIIVDDVTDDIDLRLLSPGSCPGYLLLTSRERVEALPGVRHHPVDPLTIDDASELLRRLLTREGRPLSADVRRDLVSWTGLLPLEVTLLAGRMSARPGWTEADHTAHELRRRELLRIDASLDDAVRSAYERLDPGAQRALRLLAHQPCPTLGSDALTALWGVDPASTRSWIAALGRHQLVRTGHVDGDVEIAGMHDVVRVFGIDAGHREDAPSELTQALVRLEDHYLELLWAASEHLHDSPLRATKPAGCVPPPMSVSRARSWVAAHLDNLMLVATTSARDEVVGQVSEVLQEHLLREHRLADMLRLAEVETAAGHRLGQPRAIAMGRFRAGSALLWQSTPRDAERLLHQALPLLRDVPDYEPAVLNSLALASFYGGHLAAALSLFRELAGPGVPLSTRRSALWNTGLLLNDLGRYDEADTVLAQALEIEAATVDDPATAVWAQANLAEAYTARGEHARALVHADHAERLVRRADGRLTAHHATGVRCSVLVGLGRYAEAAANLVQLRTEARASGNRPMELNVLVLVSRASLGLADAAEAERAAREALAIATEVAAPLARAAALVALGDSLNAGGDRSGARSSWLEAERLYDGTGAAVARGVHERLADNPDGISSSRR